VEQLRGEGLVDFVGFHGWWLRAVKRERGADARVGKVAELVRVLVGRGDLSSGAV
jgi:hypothetical protein